MKKPRLKIDWRSLAAEAQIAIREIVALKGLSESDQLAIAKAVHAVVQTTTEVALSQATEALFGSVSV
jgi:hypothetical protein